MLSLGLSLLCLGRFSWLQSIFPPPRSLLINSSLRQVGLVLPEVGAPSTPGAWRGPKLRDILVLQAACISHWSLPPPKVFHVGAEAWWQGRAECFGTSSTSIEAIFVKDEMLSLRVSKSFQSGAERMLFFFFSKNKRGEGWPRPRERVLRRGSGITLVWKIGVQSRKAAMCSP